MSATYSEGVETYRGYRITSWDFGYSAYKGGACVACGGVLGCGEKGNRAAAKQAVRDIIAGKRKPLTTP